MKLFNGLLAGIFVLSTTGCASMYTPDSSLIDTLPVVKMGDKKPEGHEYIFYIPEKTEFPVHFTVKGGLISLPVDQKNNTRISKDLYIYKNWLSLDGRRWQPSRNALNVPVGLGVGPEGAQVHVNVDLVEK